MFNTHQQVIHHWISECYVPGSGVSSIVEIQVKVAIQFDLRETNEDRTGKLQCGQWKFIISLLLEQDIHLQLLCFAELYDVICYRYIFYLMAQKVYTSTTHLQMMLDTLDFGETPKHLAPSIISTATPLRPCVEAMHAEVPVVCSTHLR